MTTFRFRVGILVVALLFVGGFFAWRYVQTVRWQSNGERVAGQVAAACGIPSWALYFDPSGNRQFGGRGPKRPEYAGIYMEGKKYAFCPSSEREASIQCAKRESERRGYPLHQELVVGGCDRDKSAE